MTVLSQPEREQVVQTILEQCRAQGVRANVWLTDQANMRLRVHQKPGGGYVVNTDITFDRDRDLYDVTVCRMDFRMKVRGEFNDAYGDVVARREYTGVYADQLGELVGAWR